MNNPSLPTRKTDLTGRQLGNYRILRRLGRGGMADVYLAEQVTLQRSVALKVLREDLALDSTYVRRFELEARAAAALEHENIVRIYEVGSDQGVYYIAQEYIQGCNLREYMVRYGPPPLDMAVNILRQVAMALHRAGLKGIVHRDIKPENILITKDGQVKVADFGLARFAAGSTALNLTQTGTTLGTPLYMSPEQIEGRPVDHRSDIYSLGVTAYHMLAGVPPFRGDNALSVAVQHVKAQPERLENLVEDLPPALCRIVHRMLEKDPAQRYASAADLLHDLNRLRLPGEGPAQPPQETIPLPEVPSTPAVPDPVTQRLEELMHTQTLQLQQRPWRSWLGTAVAVLGAVLIGGIIAYQSRPRSWLHASRASAAGVPRLPTAEAQLLRAMQLADSAPHWQAVLQYYPDHHLYVLKAKKELALLYLRNQELEAALRLFDEFAGDREAAVSSRLFGLAGQGVVHALRGDNETALVKFENFQQLYGQYRSPRPVVDERLARLMQAVYRRLREDYPQQADAKLERLLSEIQQQQTETSLSEERSPGSS